MTPSQIAAHAVKNLLLEEQEKARRRKWQHEPTQGTIIDIIAEKVKVGRVSVYRAKKVMEHSPELFKQVLAGTISMKAAMRQLPHKKIKKHWTVLHACRRINMAIERELAFYH
jgi:hypothetical protein